jgi:deazaflavin-dependent oxidoreductase (nitroreductase family)
MAEDTLRRQLDEVAAFEARVRVGPVTRLMRRAGRVAAIARVYRTVGPIIDPRIRELRDGRVMAAVYGLPLLALHTIGSRSGEPRRTALLYIRDGDDIVLIGTNFGQPKHPAWTGNLLAHPEASVEIGPVTLRVRARLVDEEAWPQLFARFVAVYPGYQDYLGRREGLVPRMFRLSPLPPADA